MSSEYVKETIIKQKNDDEKDRDLMLTILETKKILYDANINYEFAEGKLIDYFLYTMKAQQAKLDYLINTAKDRGISLEIIDNINIKNIDL